MTARHSAAVARYSREIAAAGRPLGRAIRSWSTPPACCTTSASSCFPDSILKSGRRRLTDDEWEAIKTHPAEGARIVSQIDGYQPIGEIILAHHERIDGQGYPARPRGRRHPRARADHLRRRHLRRDDRPRHLSRPGQLLSRP